MDDIFFQVMFVVIFVGFTAIRVYYHQLAVRTMGKAEFREGKLHMGLRVFFGVAFLTATGAYAIAPELMAWAKLPWPGWTQWVGVVLGLASLPLLLWVHRALGSNFSGTLHVREEHTLVVNGPYRWVRHPMYTQFYMFVLGLLLLTQNWFIGGVPLIALTAIVVTRIGNEEAAMTEKFGDQYRAYMRHTGRFLPRLAIMSFEPSQAVQNS